MLAAAILENKKLLYLSTGWQIYAKFGMVMQNESLNLKEKCGEKN